MAGGGRQRYFIPLVLTLALVSGVLTSLDAAPVGAQPKPLRHPFRGPFQPAAAALAASGAAAGGTLRPRNLPGGPGPDQRHPQGL
jgi:hypothetical protein